MDVICNINIKCGIYKITSPSGRVYIGESKDIERRWKSYKSMFNCKNQTKLLNSFKKYEVKNHTFEIIEECLFEELRCRERFWQDKFNALNEGLNCKLTECGEVKQVCCEETKMRMSQAQKGKVVSEETKQKLREVNSGEKNHFYGKKHSEKTKEKISKAHRGKVVSDKTREKQRQNNLGENSVWYGKTHSKETKEKMSNSRIGEKNPSAKLVLDLNTGIFYNTAKEASESCCINTSTFYAYITGRLKKEHFNYIYV